MLEHERVFDGLDYLFWLDVDFEFRDYACDEMLGEIVVCRHPGHPSPQHLHNLPFETRIESAAYVPPEKRQIYFFGAFLGGSLRSVFEMVRACYEMTQMDKTKGITPIWHDESISNAWLNTVRWPSVILGPSYAYPEANWSYELLGDIPKIIVHRAKTPDFRENV